VLDAADSEEGKKWFKQIVIEGFTDTDGSYLYNLHLSLQRSEWVMCSLLDSRSPLAKSISAEQQIQIRKLFLAGESPSIMPRKARKPVVALSYVCSSSGSKINEIRLMWISPCG
jgi:hypothetical protein